MSNAYKILWFQPDPTASLYHQMHTDKINLIGSEWVYFDVYIRPGSMDTYKFIVRDDGRHSVQHATICNPMHTIIEQTYQ